MPITLSSARATPSDARAFENIVAGTMTAAGMTPLSLTDCLHKIQDYGARRHFNRNEPIFVQGEPANQVYRLISGSVRLCRYTPDGRRSVMDFLFAEDLLGFVEGARQPAAAEAVSDVTLVAYPRQCFERLAANNAGVRTGLVRHLSRSLEGAQQHLMVLGCQNGKERMASFLLRLADPMDLVCGDRLDLVMGRQDIADHLGLTIETVSRVLATLRELGAILIPNSHQIVLRDIAALRALCAQS